MPPASVIQANDKFGRLTAVRFIDVNQSRQQRWLFKCDCGSDRVHAAPLVKGGYIKSCGCSRKKVLSSTKQCLRCKVKKARSEFQGTYCGPCRAAYEKERVVKKLIDDPEWKSSKRRANESKSGRISKMFSSVRGSAQRRKLQFDISREDIERLIEAQEWKCGRTGIQFDLTTGCGTRPFGPSIDRIDSRCGYVAGNIQIVCNLYNFAKMNFTDSDVMAFAAALIEHSKTTAYQALMRAA